MTLLSFLLAILILVGFHEFGHYSAARMCGVRVLKFSIGFGPALWESKPNDQTKTKWVIGTIPLGGFVKLLDGRDPEQKISANDLPHAFNRQALWKRSAIVAAGPLANFVLAIVLLTGLFSSGIQQVRPNIDPGTESVAYRLGISYGDQVIGWQSEVPDGANAKQLTYEPLQSWNRLRWKLMKAVMQEESFAIQLKSSQRGTYEVIFPASELTKLNFGPDLYKDLGLKPSFQEPIETFEMQLGFSESLSLAIERVWDISVISVQSIGHLVSGKASLSQLSGPVAIADMAGKTAQVGLSSYIGFLALISISLGILNLLPFPLLDGGQLMYDLWEFITGKQVSIEIQTFLQKIGLAGLLTLTLFTFMNDITRIFLR